MDVGGLENQVEKGLDGHQLGRCSFTCLAYYRWPVFEASMRFNEPVYELLLPCCKKRPGGFGTQSTAGAILK